MFNVERRSLLRAGLLVSLAAPIAAAAPVPPARADGTNLLVNPSFEAANEQQPGLAASWVTSTPQYVSRDTTVGRTGSASLHIAAPTGNGAPWAFQQVEVVEGGMYQITAWCRRAMSQTAMIKFEFYSGPITTADTWVKDATISAAGSASDWEQVTGQVTVPPGARVAKVYLRFFSPCDGWWDDVSLTFVAMSEPVQLSLVTDQGVYYPDVTSANVTVGVTPADGVLTGKSVRLTVAADGAAPVVTQTKPAAAEVAFSFAADVMALRTPYQVSAELLDSAGAVLYDLSSPVIRWQRPAMVNSDEELLVDGKPWFPVIMYHVGAADYPLMPQIGVNTVQLGGGTVAEIRAGLDAAQANGLKAFVALYAGMRVKENADWHRQLIPAVKDHPAVLAWALMDEPDGNNKMAEIFDGYRLVRSLDDVHPVYMVSCFPDQYRNVEHSTDVFVTDIYPLDNKPIGTVGRDIDIATSVATEKPVWQILQAFYLPGYGWTYLPTITDVRNMAHQSINHGVTGIGFYSFTDPGWRLSDSPLWPGLVAFRDELAQLGRLAISRTARRISLQRTDTVEYAIFQDTRSYWVSVLNLTKQPQQVSVPLPAQLRGATARPRFGVAAPGTPLRLADRAPSVDVTLERHGCQLIEVTR